MELYQIAALDSCPERPEVVICANAHCRAHFTRLEFESWRKVCPTCVRWNEIGLNIYRTKRLFKELARPDCAGSSV